MQLHELWYWMFNCTISHHSWMRWLYYSVVSMETGKSNQFSLHVWSDGQRSILPPQKTADFATANFSNLPLYFFLYLLLKTPISSFFFPKLIFSPFISLHLAPSLSRVMLLKGFLLFCNEGSWCCQHRLAASPALLFYSGLAKKSLISKSNETPPSQPQSRHETGIVKNILLFFYKWPSTDLYACCLET